MRVSRTRACAALAGRSERPRRWRAHGTSRRARSAASASSRSLTVHTILATLDATAVRLRPPLTTLLRRAASRWSRTTTTTAPATSAGRRTSHWSASLTGSCRCGWPAWARKCGLVWIPVELKQHPVYIPSPTWHPVAATRHSPTTNHQPPTTTTTMEPPHRPHFVFLRPSPCVGGVRAALRHRGPMVAVVLPPTATRKGWG
mmetsp:Transcript_15664/g.46217  ORF Transcript_15664/g.46217 Transcript_15664/m.46217 type:complete len:202 (-) Transcript_15664:671-1276(-)